MHETFLQHAIDLAVNNAKTADGGPYGAVIAKDNQIVAAAATKSPALTTRPHMPK